MNEPSAEPPGHVLDDYARAFSLVGRGALDQAIPILQSCVDQCPDYLPARRELAYSLTQLGRTQAAIEHRLKVFEREPDDVKNALKCINLLSQFNRYAEALPIAEAVVRRSPGNLEHVRLLEKIRTLVRVGRIFISYKSNDASAARSVAELLLRHDFDVWFAEYEVLSLNYDDFERELDRNLKNALTTCKSAIVITNQHWANSPYCQDEIRHISAHYDKSRILQICVPQMDEKPAKDWPILNDVATRICNFSNASEQSNLFGWILDQLELAPKNRRSMTIMSDLGSPIPLRDRYRGGTLGTLRVGPFQSRPTPFWMRILNRGDRQSMLYGWPAESFEFQSKDPNGYLGLVVDLRVDRWTGAAAMNDVDDDRLMYRQLRSIAHGGYQRHAGLAEGGLHLFHHQGHGNFAITYRTPVLLGVYTWSRVYVLLVKNEFDGSFGEANLNFTWIVSEKLDQDTAFRHFMAFQPLFEAVAKSLEYSGIKTRSPLPSVRARWALAGAALSVPVVWALLALMSGGLNSGIVYLVGTVLGALLGLGLNQRLMVMPNSQTPEGRNGH